MDLNELFYRHQLAAAGADRAASSESRRFHRCEAWDYAERIARVQRRNGATSPMIAAAPGSCA